MIKLIEVSSSRTEEVYFYLTPAEAERSFHSGCVYETIWIAY